MPHAVTITHNPELGRGARIEVDGVDVSDAVASYDLAHVAGGLPHLHLVLAPAAARGASSEVRAVADVTVIDRQDVQTWLDGLDLTDLLATIARAPMKQHHGDLIGDWLRDKARNTNTPAPQDRVPA